MTPAPKQNPAKKTPPEQAKPGGVNMFQNLAAHLSGVTGKLDPKAKDENGKAKVILQPAKVQVAGDDKGNPMIRLPGVVSTRCETLDAAIGVGGFPMSRLTVIAGGEGCGKTTICGQATAEVQAMGGIGLYIDNEHKLDLDYFKTLGVDLQKMLVTSPSTVEDSFTIMNETILWMLKNHPGKPILAVLDSLNATKSEKEYEEDGSADFREANQGGLGASARFMSTNIPKLIRAVSGHPVALVFISQPRDNIGTPGRNLVAGGNAPKFYAALGIELYRKGFWEESGQRIGGITIGKIFKNQVSKPFKEAEIAMRWGLGTDYNKSLLDQAVKQHLIQLAGSWYEIPPDKEGDKVIKWQGMKGWHKLSQDRPDVKAWLVSQIRAPYEPYQFKRAS